MSIELANVHPTRLELLRLKRRRSMAEGIVDILKKDLDALTLELFKLFKKILPIREKMYKTLREAYELFIRAEMVSGSRKIEGVAMASQPIDFKNSSPFALL